MAWEEERPNGVRGVLQQPSPGLAERGRLRWWKSPLSHRPHHPDSRRRGPAAGREAAGRANFKPPACSSLPAPRNRSRTIPGKALFRMAGPTSPPARRAQPPAGSPFRRAGFPGQDFGRPLPPPLAAPPASPHRVVRTRRESWWWCNPLLLAGSPSCANLPPGLGVSPGMCPGRQAPQPAFLALRASPASENGRERWWDYWPGEWHVSLQKPGIQGHDLKVSARCPFQSFDATSTPRSTLILLC